MVRIFWVLSSKHGSWVLFDPFCHTVLLSMVPGFFLDTFCPLVLLNKVLGFFLILFVTRFF